jgi:ribosomal protein S18 acetylase RimI-like enzyme
MPDQMKIRQAVQDDADKLVEFNLWMAMETEGTQLDPEVLASGVRAVLQNSTLGFYLVAEVDKKVIGCLMVTTEWSDWRNGAFWWIQSVYVMRDNRRRGVFSALYQEVRRRAREANQVCGFRLYVERDNAAAQATYARLGMTETKYRLFEERFL